MTTTPGERTATLSDLVAEEIRAWLGRRRMSQAQLARTLGQSQMWVSDRLRGIQPIDLDDLERIAHVLDIPVLELFPPAGGTTTIRSVSRDLNPRLNQPARKDDPKPVRHVTTRPFGPPRRDPNHPPSPVPLSTRRPRDTRPVKRPMAVAS
jgi:transcriptional regulator with XRE-family HTH domain